MYLLKYRDFYPTTPLQATMGVGGEFKFVLRDLNLRKLFETDWQPNLITNQGLINMSAGQEPFPANNWYSSMHIGTNSTPASFTDTALLGWVGSSTTLVSGVTDVDGVGPNYEFYSSWGHRFDENDGTGTIAEVGISGQTTNGNMSVRNILAAPINKGVDQILDVFYRFTVWPTLSPDVTGQIVIDGETYDYILRYMYAGDVNSNARSSFGGNSGTTTHEVFSGDIGPNTGKPSGLLDSCDSRVLEVAGGSGYNEWSAFFDLDTGNGGGGIRSIASRHSLNATAGRQGFQVQFNNASDSSRIPKDNTKTFEYQMRMNWVRH